MHHSENALDLKTQLLLARGLMREFATATGISGSSPPRRYLWTDAFAVCNFLGLYRQTGEGEFLELALRLVEQVHHVLGRHREDASRRGWISGLPEEEGERHPTRGGLRIGKPFPERRPGERFDPRLEWDRDGQYLHYLTQWMHALNRVSTETGKPLFRDWAVELAQAAHAGFTQTDARLGCRQMVWKMSIDLNRVLVPSMGQHDPLDALLSYLELQAEAKTIAGSVGEPILEREIRESRALCDDTQWETDDALGIGALLTSVCRLAVMIRRYDLPELALLTRVVTAARISLDAYAAGESLSGPADFRLAFRELGLAIGLHAVERIEAAHRFERIISDSLAAILGHRALATHIDTFWSGPDRRGTASWLAHRDINDVMLATSLMPNGYLGT